MAGAPPSTPPTHASAKASGLRCFTLSLKWVEWPPKFRPEMPPCYDGATDPAAFLHAYEEAVWAAGRDDKVKANWLPMALVGAPRTWLLNLPASFVASWEELRGLFLAHYAARAPPVVAALLGVLQAQPSDRHIKQFYRQVSAAQAGLRPPLG